MDVGGTSLRNFEAINTVISPINLSWNLGGGFFASAGLVVYTGAWTYSLNNPNNAGRNYWTIEPNFGLSYLADGWNLTVHPVIDFNGRNNLNKYQSGTIFVMDYSATKKISKWELGLGGTLIKQLSDDTIRGVTVPAVTGFNGKGNRASSLSVGPVIGYDFGDISVKGYVLRDVYADNAPKGNRFWFRVDVPLTAPPTAAGPADAGGSRS